VPLLGSVSSCSVTDSDNVSPPLQGQSRDAPPRAAAITAASSARNSSSNAATAAAAATSDSPTARRRAAEPASCTNMNVHMAQGDGREPPIPPRRARVRALAARARRAATCARGTAAATAAPSVSPTTREGSRLLMYGHEGKHDAAHISSSPARTPATRQTETRARPLAGRARRAATAARRAAAAAAAAGGSPATRQGTRCFMCAHVNIIERTAVTHSSSGSCEYPSAPRPV
jgi:hypothetical protein